MGGKMENENLDQYQGKNDEVVEAKIQLSRDNKWVIIRLNVEGKKVSVIKPVAYFEKILERTKGKSIPVGVETIK